MKKVLFAFALGSAFTGYGQFAKGTRTVGFHVAAMDFSSLSSTYHPSNGGPEGNSGNKKFTVSFNPSMGWFVSENFLIGASVNFSLENSKYTEGNYLVNKVSTFTAGAGGFGRYYFGATGFMPYGQVSIGAAFGSGTETLQANYSNYTTRGNGRKSGMFHFNTGVGLGLTKMIHKNIGLDIGLSYSMSLISYAYSYEENRQYTNNSTEVIKTNYAYDGANHGTVFSAGFFIFLDPKNK